jgi:hypothetical protein
VLVLCVTVPQFVDVDTTTNGETNGSISPASNAQQASLADTAKTQKLEKKFLTQLTRMGGNRNFYHFRFKELDEKMTAAKEQYQLALQAIESERIGSEAKAVAHLREAILRLKGESLTQVK